MECAFLAYATKANNLRAVLSGLWETIFVVIPDLYMLYKSEGISDLQETSKGLSIIQNNNKKYSESCI